MSLSEVKKTTLNYVKNLVGGWLLIVNLGNLSPPNNLLCDKLPFPYAYVSQKKKIIKDTKTSILEEF